MARAWGAGLILWQICPNCNKRKIYYDEKLPFWAINKYHCTYCKKYDFGLNLIPRKLR